MQETKNQAFKHDVYSTRNMQTSVQNMVTTGEIFTMTLPQVSLDDKSSNGPFGKVTCTKKKQPFYIWLMSSTCMIYYASNITRDFFHFLMYFLADR